MHSLNSLCTCLHTSGRGRLSPCGVPRTPAHVRTRSRIPLCGNMRAQRETADALGCNSSIDLDQEVNPITFIVHKAAAELLEGSPVAHSPQRAMELIVGHHQVLRVPRHVDHLEDTNNTGLWPKICPVASCSTEQM